MGIQENFLKNLKTNSLVSTSPAFLFFFLNGVVHIGAPSPVAALEE
jgi:hypothetical protein